MGCERSSDTGKGLHATKILFHFMLLPNQGADEGLICLLLLWGGLAIDLLWATGSGKRS